MAQTTQEFFTTAIARSGCINTSGFARRLGVSSSAPTEWKKGRSYPSDKTMLKIALLCDLDPVEALALLNLWRCDEAAKTTYQRLLEVAQSTALKCFPYIIVLVFASQAIFAEPNKNNSLPSVNRAEISHKMPHSIHYAIRRETFGERLRLFFGKVFTRLIYRFSRAGLGAL